MIGYTNKRLLKGLYRSTDDKNRRSLGATSLRMASFPNLMNP